MEQGLMVDIGDIFKFVHGGNSIFTIVSKKTGNSLTFKVKAPVTQDERRKRQYAQTMFRFVSLRGKTNDSWRYIGVLSHKNFKFTKASPQPTKAPETFNKAKTFDWFYTMLVKSPNKLLNNVDFFHEGKCGVCGKTLTVPESIKRGIGPVCAGRK